MKQTRDIAYLKEMAKALRRNVVVSVGVGFAGHIGGSCSAADMVAALYFYKMRHDPSRPDWPERDRFLLSKGHVAILQYSALAEAGYFSKDALAHTKELGSFLQGHPDRLKTPGVEVNTGSLGQGLSLGLGLALGLRGRGLDSRVYVLLGDGETAEGQVWEAAMAASAYGADNLVAIVDRNGLQATGRICERMPNEPLADKWRAFGFETLEINGHDMGQIVDALDEASAPKGKPTVILANTVKGKGISFAENVAGFHNGMLTKEQYDQALRELA